MVERKIVERLYGDKVASLKHLIGYKALQDAVDKFESRGKGRYTRLHIGMKGKELHDPDDSFSSVPYNRGCALLMHIQVSGSGGDDDDER